MVHLPNKELFSEYHQPYFESLPRQRDFKKKEEKQKKKWSFETSVFKAWKADHEELIHKCFEFDWSNTRIPKLVKDTEDLYNLKNFLKSIYKDIKNCYKHFSCINPIQDIWAI